MKRIRIFQLALLVLFLACQTYFFLGGKQKVTAAMEKAVAKAIALDYRDYLKDRNDDSFYNAPDTVISNIILRSDSLYLRLEKFIEPHIHYSTFATHMVGPKGFYESTKAGHHEALDAANLLNSNYVLSGKDTYLSVYLDYHWADGFWALWQPANGSVCLALLLIYGAGMRWMKNRCPENKSNRTPTTTIGYTLPDGSVFDPEQQLLQSATATCKLRKQTSRLLQALLEAPHLELSFHEIETLLWGNKTGDYANNRARVVSDLRKELMANTQCTIDSPHTGHYQLTHS